MRCAFRFVRLPVVLLCLAIQAMSGGAGAQQPSKELKELRETSAALWKAGDFSSALRFAEQALPLVIREYGPEHEETGLQYYSLGLISRSAGNLPLAEKHFTDTVRVREKVYGKEHPTVAAALEQLGKVQMKRGRHDAAEPLFRRALKIEQSVLGPNHVFSASGNANLGDVSLARGHWAPARDFYRQAIRLITGQDTAYEIVRRMVENEIREFRDTFVGLCRTVWQLRSEPGADRAAMIEETFVAGQLAWQTSAASALAKMTARLGTSDTELGRRIRTVQDNADKVLALHDEDQKLLTAWHAVQTANPAYRTALDEFRAASIARNRDQAPNIKRQTELVQRMTALLDQCPPGQKKAGCENADRERGVIGKELRELNEATGKGSGEIMAIHARMEAAEKALPGYDQFNTRRTAVRADIDRAERAARTERARISQSFPDYIALTDPRPLTVPAVQALLKDDEVLVAILVGSARSFVWAISRGRAEWAEIGAGSDVLAGHVEARSAGAAGCGRRKRQQGRCGARLRPQPRACTLQARSRAGGTGAGRQTAPDRRSHGPADKHSLPGAGHGAAAGRQRRPARCRVAHQEPCLERAAVGAILERAAQARGFGHGREAILRGGRSCARRPGRSAAAQREALAIRAGPFLSQWTGRRPRRARARASAGYGG
jgi:tetratricopeptide (TPR) repeat protein